MSIIKRTLLTAAAMLLALQTATAENQPYRADHLIVAVPDHQDWQYRTGDTARVSLQFYKYGIPRDASVTWEVADDMLQPDTSGSLQLHGGTGTVTVGTRQTPGFRDLRITFTVDGVKYRHHIKLAFSPEKIQPWTQEPADFTRFWQDAVKAMHRKPLRETVEAAPEYSTPTVECKLVRLWVNDRQSVFAYLYTPRGAKPGSCPAVLTPPGAGVKTIKNPVAYREWADSGCVRMALEIHGLDPRLSQGTFEQLQAAFDYRDNGYLTHGIDDPDRYYMRHVYLALVRALDYLTQMPEWDGKNLVVQGGSQGGALSVIAAGLDSRVTHCIANHPALADMGAYSAGRTGGYPHLNRIKGILTPPALRTLAYYDVVNFARHVKATTRMTWGYNDDVCPPTTSYAVWNTLKCPKESLITPHTEHWTSPDTEHAHLTWLLHNLRK